MTHTETRKLVERLLDIYVGDLFSIGNDAGWHGENMLGRLIDFHGELPPPSGFDSADAKMIFEINFVRDEHYLLGAARAMLALLPKRTQILLVVDRRYRGTVNPANGLTFTEEKCAAMLNVTPAAYRKTKQRAFERFEEWVLTAQKFCESSQKD